MARQVVKDIEEALKREFTRLTTHYSQTLTNIGASTTYDVFTGEAKPVALEANFYDEDSNPNNIQYPRIDIRFEEVAEDRTSGRLISIWEDRDSEYRQLAWPNQDRPKVYYRVVNGNDGINAGNDFVISTIKAKRVEAGYILAILSGTNKGRYIIKSVDQMTGALLLEPELVTNIEHFSFNEKTRKLYLLDPTDLSAVRVGDVFEDANGTRFPILHIRKKKRELYLGGNASPEFIAGASILRVGDVLKNIDISPIKYVVMDPSRPLIYSQCNSPYTEAWDLENYATPFDYFWAVEIKNKDRQSHIAIADRVTETVINRTRRALDILLRNPESAESAIIAGPILGDANVVVVKDAQQMCVNDSVYVCNKFGISANNQIVDIDYDTNTVTLREELPAEFNFENKSILVTNASLKLWNMYLVNGNGIMGQDSLNNFFRQEYRFKIEGWKLDAAGVKTVAGITAISVKVESEDLAVVEIDDE